MSDVLTQARTPTEAEIETGAKAFSGLNDYGWSSLPESARNEDRNTARVVLYAALPMAAPRILALAYREAARMARDSYPHKSTLARKFEALATALEEGTPE